MKLKDFATLQVGEQFFVGDFCKAVVQELLDQRRVIEAIYANSNETINNQAEEIMLKWRYTDE